MPVEGAKTNKERRWSFQKKAEVGEKIINEPGVEVKRGFSATSQKMANEPIEGKTNSPSGTATRRIADMAAKEEAEKQAKEDRIIAEDPPQIKKSSRVGIAGHCYV